MVNNADWLLKLNYVELLREVGACFSVNNMLRAECYKQRMEKGLSFLEFNYMIMQSYDFYYLFQHYGCNMQFGGNDQWSNMLGGTELIRRKLGKDAHAMTITLLLNSEGKKMGKTASGAVWLDPNKTSPFEFYQYWRNVNDGNRERPLLTGGARDERAGSSAGATALTGGHEHHVGALDGLFDVGLVVLCRLGALFRVGAGAEATARGVVQRNLDVGVRTQQILRIRIDGDEFHILQPLCDHAVDCVAARATDTDDLNIGFVVEIVSLGNLAHGILLSFTYLALLYRRRVDKCYGFHHFQSIAQYSRCGCVLVWVFLRHSGERCINTPHPSDHLQTVAHARHAWSAGCPASRREDGLFSQSEHGLWAYPQCGRAAPRPDPIRQ